MRPLVPLLFCGLLVTGCGASAPTSKADLAAAEVALTQAVRTANTCLINRIGACANSGTRAIVIADVYAAHDAFKAAQAVQGEATAMAKLQTAMDRLIHDTPKGGN